MQRQPELIDNFNEFIEKMNITIVDITREIALQIASAIISGCDLFLTNDKQLKQEKEIQCVTLDKFSLT